MCMFPGFLEPQLPYTKKNRIILGLLGWLNDIVYLESLFQGLACGWLSLKMMMITIILQGNNFPSFLVCCH